MYRVKGFTLIEFIVAIVVMSIVMIPIALIVTEFFDGISYADVIPRAVFAIQLGLSKALVLPPTDWTNAWDTINGLEVYRSHGYQPGTSNNVRYTNWAVYKIRNLASGKVLESKTLYNSYAEKAGYGSTGYPSGNQANDLVLTSAVWGTGKTADVLSCNLGFAGSGDGNYTMTALDIKAAGSPSPKLITIYVSSPGTEAEELFYNKSGAPLSNSIPTRIDFRKYFFMYPTNSYIVNITFNKRPNQLELTCVFCDGSSKIIYAY